MRLYLKDKAVPVWSLKIKALWSYEASVTTVEPGYNDVVLGDTSSIASMFYGTNEFLTVNHNIILLGY
jgi:hypothetical protein